MRYTVSIKAALKQQAVPAAQTSGHMAGSAAVISVEKRGILMKKLTSFALVVSKATEILHWAGAASVLLLLILSFAARSWLYPILSEGALKHGAELSTYGLEMTVVNADGSLHSTALTLFFVGAVVILCLMAMVFRNVYLILKTAQGKTKFSKGVTPFQPDIVRMIREIGIFYLAVPVVGLIATLAVGPKVVEPSVRLDGFITGILLLCLSQFFDQGTKLQTEVDGLV